VPRNTLHARAAITHSVRKKHEGRLDLIGLGSVTGEKRRLEGMRGRRMGPDAVLDQLAMEAVGGLPVK
jgi:hypothetical protein